MTNSTPVTTEQTAADLAHAMAGWWLPTRERSDRQQAQLTACLDVDVYMEQLSTMASVGEAIIRLHAGHPEARTQLDYLATDLTHTEQGLWATTAVKTGEEWKGVRRFIPWTSIMSVDVLSVEPMRSGSTEDPF